MANQLRIKRSTTTAIGSVGTVAFGELIYTEADNNLYIADSTNSPVQIGKKVNGNASQFLNGAGQWATPAGSGDVSFNAGTAPADNALVRFDGVTGTIIQESGIIIDDTENVSGVGTLNTHTIPGGTSTFLLASNIGSTVQGYDANTAKYDATTANFTGTLQEGGSNVVTFGDTDVSTASFVDTDNTFASASNSVVPSQLAVKTYVDNAVASEMTYRGGYDAATNTPDLDTSPSGISIGDMYTVTVAGTFFTTAVEVGDVLIAEQNSPTLETHWTIVNKNLDGVASSATTITAGIGLVGGGDLTTNRTLDLNFNELTAQTTGASTDEIAVQLTGNGVFRKMTVANFLDGGTF